MCQVEQLPCPGVSLSNPGSGNCRLQANGHQFHNLHSITHQPWVNQPPTAAMASTPSSVVRHKVNGAVGGWSSSPPDCSTSRLGEGAAARPRRAPGRVLVTGGGGYFGFRLGRALASRGIPVILMDLHKPPWDTPDGAVFHQVRGDA